MVCLQILTLLFLVFICWQDLVYRGVYWWCFPVLAAILFLMKCNLTGIAGAITDTGSGLLFLSLQLLVIWVYFSIKNKKPVNITKEYLGWGDVLFLAVIVCYLSPANYVVFYVLSLIAVLLYVALTNLIKKGSQQIPLAGLQAALLVIIMIADACNLKFNLYTDSWIFYLLKV